MTELFLLLLCGVVALTGYKSDRAALLAIVVCLSYIGIGWVSRGPNTNECLIGKEKKVHGVLFGGCVDVWHVRHVLFWVLLGLLSPNRWKLALATSVAWELAEHVSFKYYLKSCDDIVCARVEDVFLNMIGYGIGSFLGPK